MTDMRREPASWAVSRSRDQGVEALVRIADCVSIADDDRFSVRVPVSATGERGEATQ